MAAIESLVEEALEEGDEDWSAAQNIGSGDALF